LGIRPGTWQRLSFLGVSRQCFRNGADRPEFRTSQPLVPSGLCIFLVWVDAFAHIPLGSATDLRCRLDCSRRHRLRRTLVARRSAQRCTRRGHHGRASRAKESCAAPNLAFAQCVWWNPGCFANFSRRGLPVSRSRDPGCSRPPSTDPDERSYRIRLPQALRVCGSGHRPLLDSCHLI
jgi:hypothetical protein